MKVFLVSFFFGILQTVLTRFLIWSVTKRNGLYAIILFAVKFLLYGYGIYIFMNRYLSHITFVGFGYIIGMVAAAFGLFIYTAFFRKQ